MDDHPEGVQSLTNQLLTLLLRVSDVVHDVADDVVVQSEGGLYVSITNVIEKKKKK